MPALPTLAVLPLSSPSLSTASLLLPALPPMPCNYTPRYLLAALLGSLLVCLQFAYLFRASVATSRTQAASQAPIQLSCVRSGKGGKLPGTTRDCKAGQGDWCSQADPCTPCAYGGCQACSASNVGECSFLPGVGPYCLDPITGVSGPCTQCCT